MNHKLYQCIVYAICAIAFVILAVTRSLSMASARHYLPFRQWSMGFVISKRSKIAK